MRGQNDENSNKFIVPFISFALLLACQHVDVSSAGNAEMAFAQCKSRPFSLEIVEKKPIFKESELPRGILLFDSAKLYVEKLDKMGDVQEKVHVSEQYESPRRENLKVQVHCIDVKDKKKASNFESSFPALKKIAISEKGNSLESNKISLKFVNGKVEFNSKLSTEPTGATTLKDFFGKFGVKYAFYKMTNDTYELRGFTTKDGVSSYIAVQYHLVMVE